MMLWPISMFSRILATDRPAVPTSQAGGKRETSSTARLPISRIRWALMTLRMYAASAAPRLARTSSRIASSSLPSSSICSGLRCAVGSGLPDGFCWGTRMAGRVTVRRLPLRPGVFGVSPGVMVGSLVGSVVGALVSVAVMIGSFGGRGRRCSQVDAARAGGGRHAGLDEDAVLGRRGGDLAVAQVSHGAFAQRRDAAEADAHAAAGRHQDAGLFAGVQQRGGSVGLEGDPAPGEGDGSALTGGQHRGAKPLGVELFGDSRCVPVLLCVIQKPGRSARPGLTLRPVGDQGRDVLR